MDVFSVCISPPVRSGSVAAIEAAIDAAVFALADLSGLPAPLVFGLGLSGLGFAVFFGLSWLARVVERIFEARLETHLICPDGAASEASFFLQPGQRVVVALQGRDVWVLPEHDDGVAAARPVERRAREAGL